jgi:hypothetical protein
MGSNGHSRPYDRVSVGKPPYGRDKLPEMEVITEAKKLERHTLILTSNEKRYPKKYRITFVNRIQAEALDITGDLMEANDLLLNDEVERELRFRAQRSALRNCRRLIHHIETSLDMGMIDAGSFEYWAKMANDVRNMAAAWYQSDKKRAAKIDAQKQKK